MQTSGLIGGFVGAICGTALVLVNQPGQPAPAALRARMPVPDEQARSRLDIPEMELAGNRVQQPADEDGPVERELSVAEVRERYQSATAGERFHMLQQLAASQEKDAIDLLLEIIETDPDSVGGSPSIWMLLRGVDDPRIYPYPFARGRLVTGTSGGAPGSA